MHRPPDVENIRDFSQYYFNSWIGYKNGTEKYIPTYISRVGDETNIAVKAILNDSGDSENRILTWRNLRDYGQFGHPRVGAVNLRDTSGYITRNSARTAHRGYRFNAAHMHVFGMWVLSNSGMKMPNTADYSVIFNVFNPSYFPLKTLLDQLEQGERLAGAISRKISLSMEEGFSWPAIYYGTHQVGYLEHGYLLTPLDAASLEYAKIIKDRFPEIRVQE